MKGLPLPVGLPWEIQILIWVLGGLAAGLLAMAIWFIVRHINAQDDGFKKVHGRLDTHETKMEVMTKKIGDHAEKITNEAVEMKKSNLGFQVSVNKELAVLEKRSLQIEATLDRTHEKANQLEKKFDQATTSMATLSKNVEGIQKTVEGHQRSLSLGAKAMVKQREEMLSMKTTVTKINDKVTLIGQKYVPKSSGGEDPEGDGTNHKG